MKTQRCIIIFAGLAIVCGCASQRRTAVSSGPTTGPASSQPAVDAIARLTLGQIEPVPVLGQPKPTTRPAPLEAIELYARARDAMLENQRYSAINFIERAIAIDPDSFELHYALGRAYQGIGSMADRAITSLERAAEINPNDLGVQTELARMYQARNDFPHAIERLRLATQTDEYKNNDPLSAVIDYRLAAALEQKGYDRAALESYKRLLNRLEHFGGLSRGAPEIGFLLSRPELVYDEIGKLNERLGDYAQALEIYKQVAEGAPNDFDLQARVVRTLVALGRKKEAIDAAAQVVRTFHASFQSIDLLKDVYQKSGTQGAFADAMRKLHREHPNDRAILFTLADTLAASGQIDQARQLLERGIDLFRGDVEVVSRLCRIYTDRDQVADAARLIIRVNSTYPGTTSELQPLFLDLMRLSRKNSLRLTSLQKVEVPPEAEPAKQYWIWRVATIWTRPPTARAALELAGRAIPPFDPACRALLDSYLNRSDWDDGAKNRATDGLIESVKSHGRPDLSAELSGLRALRANRVDLAIPAFAEAVKLVAPPGPSPDLQLEYALATLRSGNSAKFEQLMAKLLSDRPHFDPAYQLLISYYKQNNADGQAWNLVNTWLVADPNNPAAKIQEAVELVAQRRADQALSLIHKLFEQRPDDSEVVSAFVLLLNAAGQIQDAVDLLSAECVKHPGNRVAVEAMVDIYQQQNRAADAARVIDAARAAVSGDPDLLYYIAHLYQRIDRPQKTEEVLQEVLRLDPTHAQAGNDLGYTWADEGKNLERAESLIRIAVQAEPDNPAYLDSLAWVLYKRSHFDEATKLLQQATDPAESADPVVLDHLGDALYRQNRSNDAQQAWQNSLQRASELRQRDDLEKLQQEVQTKLKQAQSGQPVNVAPVVETAPPIKEQAKN